MARPRVKVKAVVGYGVMLEIGIMLRLGLMQWLGLGLGFWLG
jgi:hypothetical protein